MLSYRTIEPHTLELLKFLMRESAFSKLRLVGGTALALQYGHRVSVDLDLFGEVICDDDTIRSILNKYGQLRVVKESPNIKVYILNEIKIDIVNYKYEWLSPALIEDGVRLATPNDIAAMKINAIIGRGSKKDFIDIYILLQHYTLDDVLNFYALKYPENSMLRAVMSLTYFEDAENQIAPKMFTKISWESIKTSIKKTISEWRSS